MSACGKLHAATLELSKSSSIKQRLTNAYSKHLREIVADELPAALVEQWASILRDLETVRPLPGETAVQATVRKMSADEADRIAAKIVELSFAATSARLAAVPAALRPEPPSLGTFRERAEPRHSGGQRLAAEA